MSKSARDIVDKQLAKNPPNPDTRPPTPEPTTESGVRRHHAHYNTPERGQPAAKSVSGRRNAQSTARGKQYTNEFNRKEAIRKKASKLANGRPICGLTLQHPRNATTTTTPGTAAGMDKMTAGTTTAATTGMTPMLPFPSNRSPSPPHAAVEGQGPSGTYCDRRHPDRPTTNPTQSQSQPRPQLNHKPTLDHARLIKYAEEKLGFDLGSRTTQEILSMLRVAEGKQASQMGLTGLSTTAVVKGGSPFQVGSRWHLESTALGTGTSSAHGKKRTLDTRNKPDGSNKRQHVAPENNTATEDKTKDESPEGPSAATRGTAKHMKKLFAGPLNQTRPSGPGTRAPPPTRKPTEATVPARDSATPLRPDSFGATQSQLGQAMLPLLMLLAPVRGPVHARLRTKAIQCYLDSVDCEVEAAEANRAATTALNDEEVDELAPTDAEEVPKTQPARSQHASVKRANSGVPAQRTYRGSRSHIPTPAGAASGTTEDREPILWPNLPNLSQAELIRMERMRAVMAKATAKLESRLSKKACAQLFAEAKQAPTTRPQV
ncbi:hypothetical protein FRC07_001348 [Ceratobasidium sp. 392]|nr:hypothetical protein FRC07_001348 [Ceratobasidium sp. 392]